VGVSYATIEDFQQAGLPGGALGSVTKTDQKWALERASAIASTYVGDKYTMQITPPYDQALVDAVCQIAAWRLLVRRGFNPQNDGDGLVRQGYLDAIKWLERVANGQARLSVQEPTPSLQPNVSSNDVRGYSPDPNVSNAPRIGGGLGGWGVG
jgi:phage gp36-like protein